VWKVRKKEGSEINNHFVTEREKKVKSLLSWTNF